MLRIEIPTTELFDENKREFITVKECSLLLEHSLLSLHKWESIWKKPFMTKDDKTIEETISYVKCMTLNKNVDPNVYFCITDKHLDEIMSYMKDPMTATTFTKSTTAPGREIITAEIVYWWMTQLQIPFECNKWHLNQLFALIETCSRKNAPGKKMSRKDLVSRNKSLNAQRKARLGSRG